jgi:hypothetical protein
MQPSQSSTTVAFRALVMLSFIIAIPLVAINGSSLPEKAKRLLDNIWPTFASVISTTNSSVLPEAPPYKAGSQASPALPSQNDAAMPSSPHLAAVNNQPNLLPVQAPDGVAQLQSSNPQAGGVVPTNYQSAAEKPVDTVLPSSPANAAQAPDNPFMVLQTRLRQLGATYYLLETWGNQRQFYRFYCQMAVGGNAGYTRYFEATDANPLAAMADVLRQVEAWRGGDTLAK